MDPLADALPENRRAQPAPEFLALQIDNPEAAHGTIELFVDGILANIRDEDTDILLGVEAMNIADIPHNVASSLLEDFPYEIASFLDNSADSFTEYSVDHALASDGPVRRMHTLMGLIVELHRLQVARTPERLDECGKLFIELEDPSGSPILF